MGSEFALLLVIVGTNTALYYANAKFHTVFWTGSDQYLAYSNVQSIFQTY